VSAAEPARRCRHCGYELPADAPPGVTSCTGYADWLARQLGDRLPENQAHVLTLDATLCALTVALREGRDELPDVPWPAPGDDTRSTRRTR
jgi:hypothetical protein